jgi:hypothetical protein
MAKLSVPSSHCASIQEKIRLAHNLYLTHKGRLLGSPRISDLLHAVRQSTNATNESMRKLGIIELCRQCDEEGGGSCCGAGIENKYDGVLLLINLLLEASLPEHRYDAASCYFASKLGCVLLVRHVLCVNYLCSRIEQALSHDEIIRVQRVAGSELDRSFMLHQTVKKIINSATNVRSLSTGNDLSHHHLL